VVWIEFAIWSLTDLATEALDLLPSSGPKLLVQSFPGLELLTVDEQRVRPAEGVSVLVNVAEQREAPVFERCRTVIVLAVEARDIVVHQLRCGRVVAHDDETGRHADASFIP